MTQIAYRSVAVYLSFVSGKLEGFWPTAHCSHLLHPTVAQSSFLRSTHQGSIRAPGSSGTPCTDAASEPLFPQATSCWPRSSFPWWPLDVTTGLRPRAPPHETWKFSLGPGAVHHRSCASPCRNRRFSACGSSHPAADSASHQSPGGSSQLRKGWILTAPDSDWGNMCSQQICSQFVASGKLFAKAIQ